MVRRIEGDIDLDAWIDNEGAHNLVCPSQITDRVLQRFGSDSEGAFGTAMPWPKTKGKWALRPHELTIWAGYNGHFKSALTGQLALHLAAIGEPVCVASFEMPITTTLYRMSRQAVGPNFPTRERVAKFHENSDFRIWLFDWQGELHWSKVKGLARFLGLSHDPYHCKHLIVDSLMKLGIATDDYAEQQKAVNALKGVANETGIHVHLIHHVRKGMDEFKMPNKSDIKGAGEIMDLADNGVIVWRNRPKEEELRQMAPDHKVTTDYDVKLNLCKQRDGEFEGIFGLYHHAQSMQFVESMDSVTDYTDLLAEAVA